MGGIFAGCGPVKTRGGVNDVNLQESDMPKLPEVIDFLDENISVVSKEKAAEMLDRLEKLQQEFLPNIEKRFYNDETIQVKMSEVYTQGFDLGKVYEIEDEKVREKNSGYRVETAEGMF